MAREIWAKVYVNLRYHPKLIGRPDSDFRLWVGLILHAKEHCSDFIVRDLTPADMRGAFGIKAPVKAVEEGLKYFTAKGMLVEVPGGLLIRDMAERQAKAGDTPEAHAERQRKYKLRTVSDVTRRVSMTSPPPTRMTSPQGVTQVSAGDAETETDTETEISLRSGESSSTSVDVEKARALELEPWDAGLLKKLQTALGVTDLDDGWGAFVGQSLQVPVEKRHAAAREFLRRGCAKDGKGWPYLLSMIKNGAGKHAEPKPVINADPVSPERKAQVDRELAELRRGRG